MSVAGLSLSAGIGASEPAHVAGPPPAHTGGFGEPTCLICHLGSSLNEPGSELLIEGLGETYEPGATYRVTVRLLSFDMNAAGFQAAFRWVDGERAGESAGRARALDGRVSAGAPEGSGVEYIQHTAPGTPADGERAEWTFEWTAPSSGGSVVLHVAANSGNGDNSPLDDLVFARTLIMESSGAPSL